MSFRRVIKIILPPIIGGLIGAIIGSWLIPLYFNRPIIDYYLDTPQSYASYGVNSVCFNFQNRGGLDAHAIFIVAFTNATLSDQTDMPYQKVNDSTVRFYYVLPHHMERRGRREVYFTINNGVARFSIDLTVECNDLFADKIGYYKTNPSYNKISNNLYELIVEPTTEPPPVLYLPLSTLLIAMVVGVVIVFALKLIIVARKRERT